MSAINSPLAYTRVLSSSTFQTPLSYNANILKKTEISKKLRENLREIIYNIPTYVASRHTTISYQRCYYKAPQHYYHEHHHNNLITNRPVLVILTYSPTVTLQFSCTIISPLTQIRTGKPITEHDILSVASLPVSP